MSCIKTYTGVMFDPLYPESELIDILDIAHALSMLCRANGHFRSFYSVGQHCINCALEAKARGYSKRVQLACLIHDATCPCFQYLNGEIDGYQLDELCRDGGFVCYESQMLKEWTAFAGYVLKGDRKEEPKKIRNVQINSLAVLTTRKPDMPEEDRFIFGVFLVDDADEGDNLNEGFVKSNSQYRIELTPAEAVQIKFWNYHANDNSPEKAAWSQGLYRYTTDIEAVQILKDIIAVKRVPAEKKFTQEFLAHFCKMKGINPAEIPEPNGALMR